MHIANQNKSKLIPTIIFTLLSINSSQVFAKQYYKWVDSKGSTHYTATPPPKNAKNKSKVDTYGYTHTIPVPASQSVTAPTTTPIPVPAIQNNNNNPTSTNTAIESQPRQNNAVTPKTPSLSSQPIQAQ